MYRINDELTLTPDDVFDSVFFFNGKRVIMDLVAATVLGVGRTKLNRLMRRNFQGRLPELLIPLSPEERTIIFYSFPKSRELYGSIFVPCLYTEKGIEEAGKLIARRTNSISGYLFLKAAFKNNRTMGRKSKSGWLRTSA